MLVERERDASGTKRDVAVREEEEEEKRMAKEGERTEGTTREEEEEEKGMTKEGERTEGTRGRKRGNPKKGDTNAVVSGNRVRILLQNNVKIVFANTNAIVSKTVLVSPYSFQF